MTVARPSPIINPEAGAVPFRDTVLKLWGDSTSGRVNDLIYVSNEKIQQIIFTLPPGGRFGHSERSRTNMGADELFYVLSGTLVLANPETGEVHRVTRGEAVCFGPDTWHHGLCQATEELRVLEYFAPPPPTGSSQAYARTKPYLSAATYTQDQWLGRWPEAAREARATHTQRLIRPDDVLWRLEGAEAPILVGLYMSTDKLTVGYAELLPGQMCDPHTHGGDEVGYVLEGRLNLLFSDYPGNGRGNGWFQMDEGDGFLIPTGQIHQYFNMTDHVVRFMFGVAPTYLPAA